MTIGLISITSLLVIIAAWYFLRRTNNKERQHLEQIKRLEAQIENLKARRMTATGGLGARDKARVLDFIALIDMLEDDNELVKQRAADLKRRMIEFLKEKK